MTFLARKLVLAVSMFVAGCGEKSAPATGGDPAGSDEPRGCATDTEAQPFSQGMSQIGKNGFKVAIESDPPVPTLGDRSRWRLTLTDATSGEPVADGTTVAVDCVMTHSDIPSHGCPTRPRVQDTGPGLYEAYPVIFNMTGHWQVNVQIGALDSVRFELCVE